MESPRPEPNSKLAQIQRDLCAAQPETRGQAMQALLLWARQDPSIHPTALPIFQAALETAQEPWTTSSAARGIEHIAGPDTGRKAWLTLLHHSRTDIVANAALLINDAFHTPALLELLEQRREPSIRVAALRTLGRLQNPAALPALVEHLSIPELRPHAVEALADLGDARAIPHLQPLLQDTTPAWKEDNYGPMLRVCDLVSAALARLRTPRNQNHSTGLNALLRPESQRDAVTPTRSPTSAFGPKPYWAAYVPLAAVILEIPWVAAIIIRQLFLTGAIPTDRPDLIHRLDILALPPVAIGLLVGLVVIARGRARRLVERICLYVGCIGCGLFIFRFGWEFFH